MILRFYTFVERGLGHIYHKLGLRGRGVPFVLSGLPTLAFREGT
jgi:hypothetical protein